MTTKEKYLAFGALTLILLLMARNKARAAFYTVTDWLIPQFEGFRASPYWDNKQYTWGYGTRAPGPGGSITKEQALADVRAYVLNDYNTLRPLIIRALNANQWAALLSFSYNEGINAAKKLIPDIDGGNDNILEEHFKKYIYSGGSINPVLIDRRNTEWDIFTG